MKEKLELRKSIKAKKPAYRRHDSHKKAKLSSSWRKPKGLQNKVRLSKRGYVRKAQMGYGSPAEVRHLHESGLKMVRVSTLTELESVDAKTQGVIVSGKLGDRKRAAIVETAQKNNITILNLDAKAYLDAIAEKMKAKKELQKERETKKKEQEKEAAKAEDTKKKEEEVKEELSEEDKKKKEKEERDKVLTTTKQ